MKNIKKQFYMRWDELLLIFGLELGAFLFGELLFTVSTYYFGEDETIFELGTTMALLIPLAIILFSGGSFLSYYFNIGIGMGEVRRRLIPMTLVMTYLECLLITAAAYLLHRLELWKFQTFYKGLENELDFGTVFQWKYILIICLVITAMQAFFGMLFIKYGKTAFWILWAIYMVAMIGLPRVLDSAFIQSNKTLVNLFAEAGEYILLAGAAGISFILIAVSYFFLRKQQVMN